MIQSRAPATRSHPAHYFFETLYPYRASLTAIARASEGAWWMPEQFPGLYYLEADLRAMPLPDLYFDCGICNAVVEHAGPRDQQVALVHEICRVCRKVMFTTPNRWFLIEHRTFLPFLHWLPNQWWGMGPDHGGAWVSWDNYAARRRYYNLIGVRYLVDNPTGWWSQHHVPGVDLIYRDADAAIYEDRDALPWTFAVGRVHSVPDLAAARQALLATGLQDLEPASENFTLGRGQPILVRIRLGEVRRRTRRLSTGEKVP